MTGWLWAAFLGAAAAGAVARYLIDGIVQDRTSGAFPWGTFTVNLSGCLLLGFVTGLGVAGSGPLATVLGTGGLGAYTTFSTMTFETVRLAEEGATGAALLNVVGSLGVCLLAAAGGFAIAGGL